MVDNHRTFSRQNRIQAPGNKELQLRGGGWVSAVWQRSEAPNLDPKWPTVEWAANKTLRSQTSQECLGPEQLVTIHNHFELVHDTIDGGGVVRGMVRKPSFYSPA